MTKQARGTVLFRFSKVILYLEKPHTMRELAQKLGIRIWGAHLYVAVLRRAGYPVESRKRVVSGRGKNPLEYWIDCGGRVVLETVRMIARLRGM